LTYNPHWENEVAFPGIERPYYLNLLLKEKDRILFLIGLRRIGKTTLLKQAIARLQHQVNPKHLLYVSLDHPMVQSYSLGDIIRTYRKLHALSRKEKIYLFLDEVGYQPDALRWIKVLYDNVQIYATTSSSAYLKQQGGLLTGRHLTVRVKPLGFDEYLRFTGKETSEPHLLERYFEDYLREGGIPYYVLTKDVNYLVELVNDVLTKDILSRAPGLHLQKIKELFYLVLSRVGKPLTYNRLAKLLGTKPETVEQYLTYMEAELLHLIYRWSRSMNERIFSPKKVYLGDIGIKYALTGSYSTGSNFENAVLLEILEKEPFYWLQDGIEIDFITRTKEVYECMLSGTLTPKQEKMLATLKRQGYQY